MGDFQGHPFRGNQWTETYVSPRERNLMPAEAEVRDTAYGLKTAEPLAVERAASRMAERVARGSVLIPVPNSQGDTSANRALARAIALRAGAVVEDVLRREAPVESSRERRTRGVPGLQVEQHRITATRVPRGNLVLVDNVITTGNTMESARRALGTRAAGLAYAKAREVLGWTKPRSVR